MTTLNTSVFSPQLKTLLEVARTQAVLNEFFRECQDGVGGCKAGSVGGVGVGGLLGRFDVGGSRDESSGGAAGGRGGKGEEYNDQDVGKGRRIEEDDRHGGTGLDSSEDKVGPEDCRTGGISFSENVVVGGHVEHHVCVESLKSSRQA